MSQENSANALTAALQRTHRSVLAALALCAIVAALQTWPDENPPPSRETTVVAIGLAMVVITLRRLSTSPVMSVRPRVGLLLASYAAAVALGILGAYIAASEAAVQTGLVFIVAAAIFCLRPPPHFAPPASSTGGGS